MTLQPNEYRCAMCGNVYEKEIPDEEAMQETQGYWPGIEQEDCVVVCDDCWQLMHPASHPAEYQESLDEYRKGRTFKEIAEEIRARQHAPVDPDAPPSVHINWGVNELTGKANPPPTDPETLRAMDELIAAAYKAWREGKLPRKEQSDAM